MVDNSGERRDFSVGQCVLVRDYKGRSKRKEGTVFSRLGLLSYFIKTAENKAWKVTHRPDTGVLWP